MRPASQDGSLCVSRFFCALAWIGCGVARAALPAETNALALPHAQGCRAPAPLPSGSVAGSIVIQAGGQENVIRIGEPTQSFRARARWHLTRRIVVRKARPLWSRTDGRPMREIRAYRRRQFTGSGELVGRPVDIAVRVELWVDLPRTVRGVRASVSIQDCEVTAHEYTSSWGRIRSIDEEPTEVGRLLLSVMQLRAGSSRGSVLATVSRGGEWSVRALRVVRLAGRAYGLSCRYRVALEGYGRIGAGPMVLCAAELPPLSTGTPMHGRLAGLTNAVRPGNHVRTNPQRPRTAR